MKKIIDVELALQYVAGYKNIHEKLVKSFLDSYKGFDEEIIILMEKSDIYNLHMKIHSLKGICRNLGTLVLEKDCVIALDELKKNIVIKKDITYLLKDFKRAYKELEQLY